MDLSSAKVTPEQKVSLCTKYFYLGFLCLPFLWGVNAAWFFGEAFRFDFSETKTLVHSETCRCHEYNCCAGSLSLRDRRKSRSWSFGALEASLSGQLA